MKFELQKADIWKRMSAFLFDAVMLLVVIIAFIGMLYPLFNVLLDFSDNLDTFIEVTDEYTEAYGFEDVITEEEYAALDDERKAAYDGFKQLYSDERYLGALEVIITACFSMLSFGILLAFILLELVIPVFFKNGQTLGKKMFGLAVMRTNGVKLDGQAHFIRVIIGKYTMETMFPICIFLMMFFGLVGGTMGILIGVLMAVLEIFAMAKTKTNSTIHDLVSDTVVIDMASQMIFESEEDLLAYKTRIHEELANKSEY